MPAAPEAWSSQRFWDAMHMVPVGELEGIEEAYVSSAMAEFGIDPTALVFDATNFHTFIASTNARAPIAQRGHAKSKRHDLWLVGLALACSTDHQIPLLHHAVADNLPDAKLFAEALPRLIARLEAIGVEPASISVVFDKGNNSTANIGLAGVVACRLEREVYGAIRTVVVTRSEDFLATQLVGLAQTRGRVEVQLAELVRLCDGHRHKMDAAKLTARVDEALAPRWMRRLYTTTVTGAGRDDLALSWSFDEEAFEALKVRELGKRIIFTDRMAWSTRDIVVAYRSQWEVEAAFRQIKNPEHAAFRPIHHWTDQKIRVHALYSVAALMLVNLAWREADRAGIALSPNDLMETLGGSERSP